MRNLHRLAAGAAGLLAAAGIALAAGAPAGAATISSHFSHNQVAYEILSDVQFNQQRAVFTIKPGSDIAYGVGLQATVDGGDSVALAAVPEDGNYVLKAVTTLTDVTNTQPGTPFGPGVQFHTIASSDSAVGILFSQATGGTVYLEARESTAHHLVNYVEGQGPSAEVSAATLGTIVTGVHTVFHAPFLGAVALAPFTPGAAKAVISRNGVTEPAGSNVGGVAGKRITFDFFNNDLTQATTTGDMNGALILKASPALPGTGSTFGIVAPALAP
jgi:hypothetical protein